MLQRWVAFTGTDSDVPQQNLNPVESVHKETSEHRELRLRKQYEEALYLHQNNQTESAKRRFEDIAEDLRKYHVERHTATTEVRHRLGSKRPRQEESPLWERKLRFAVHRNLAEVCFQLSDYLRALKSYASALDDDRSDFLIWIRAARSAALCGRLHVARRAYETALTMRPGHWLCRGAYQAVLAAIGDADEDCDGKCTLPLANRSLDEEVVDMVRQRYESRKAEEKDARSNASEAPEIIRLDELSWACLVDALRVCLDNRLSGNHPQYGIHPVGHPVTFEYSHLTKSPQQPIATASEENSDEVMLVSDLPLRKSRPAEDDEMQVVAVHMAQEKEPGHCNGPQHTTGPSVDIASNGEHHGTDDVSVVEGPCVLPDSTREIAEDDKEVNGGGSKPSSHLDDQCGGSEPRPEIRRSSRQKLQAEASAQESDRRQTRISSGTRDSTQEDSEMIQAMLNMCIDEENTCPAAEKKSGLGTTLPRRCSVPEPDTAASKEKGTSCSWIKLVDEIQESAAVVRCLESFEDRNSGPADLLLRVLSSLSELKASQYSPTLALLWSTLREKLQLHMPGSPATTALIVEAMLVSGKKAGKAKARRFQEAGRLLSHIRVSSPDEDESCFLRVRISWLWSHLYECQGEMQRAFLSAEQTLVILQSIRTWSKEIVPDCLGPDLSGYAFSELTEVLRRRISGLKMGRDLEKARQELSKIGNGDTEAAKRTVSILSSSVHAAVRHLELDVWRDDDLRTEFSHPVELEAWERRLDAETELEPRLAVFGEACAKSSDFVGELVCFSVRLRMGVHYYAAKLRSEMEGDIDAGQNGTDSSSGRLADLLVQIRKYVAILKKLSAPGSSELWNCDVGVSGWSMEKAAGIAALTVVSLTALIMTKIPLLRFSSTSTELGASQKNRRLGFTRCMLAFARSVLLIQRCRQNAQSCNEKPAGRASSYDSVMTRKMLYVSSFCLRALVARGCCREEGTSGALIKLYVKFLYARLQQMPHLELGTCQTEGISASDADRVRNGGSEGDLSSPVVLRGGPSSTSQSVGSSDVSNEGNLVMKDDPNYEWTDVSVLRHELAQCHQCLYQVPELESISGDSNVLNDVRWLEDGCRVSKHIGLSFTTGDPSGTVSAMDTEVCKNVFLFYRKRIFEGVCRRRRDGGRAKRLREVLSRLAENLPEDAPQGVSMLPFHALNKIVTDVVETSENISREAAENVSKLEEEWNRCDPRQSGRRESIEEQKRCLQLSITFFEVFALHAMSTLSAYDSEYKKHKTAERRKRPKEVADRLFQASTECIIALRIRPWSVGAWILLGRIYVEISDLALDERELNLSSFGLYRPEDLQTLGDGDIVETVFGRAEACFGFAASLLKHPWARKALTGQLDLGPSEILGFSFDGNKDEPWCGFGDDGDLFGSFGLTNSTTSRPVLKCETHPVSDDGKFDVRQIAAVRFGEAAISVLRLRELRYFHSHWTHSTTESRLLTHPQNRFPSSIIDLASLALRQLREGQHLMGFNGEAQNTHFLDRGSGGSASPHVRGDIKVSTETSPTLEWREGYVGIERLQWYFSLIEAKLMQKVGRLPEEYLPVFQRSVAENKTMREGLRQPTDIEPLYKLHASRMKILRVVEDDASSASLLTLLERYSFKQGPIVVRVDEEKGGDKDVEDWITERKIAIAEDILSAMQFCRDSKSEVPYAEYYFKATFCRALILSEVLKDTGGALQELDKLFRTEAAAKVLDQGRDATHRGYFYKIWNYRITDTGIEPALESERKLVRWRSKTLGLYGQLLQQTGQWRLLAAIIHRLKKRSSEDLPVDGALLDDLITAYAITSRASILNSMEKSILTNAAVFEASFRRTWDIYVETLRLAQGIKRVRVCLHRGDRNETGAKRLVQSGRPRCLAAIHTTLRLEHLRWQSANGGPNVDINAMRSLPIEGTMKSMPEAHRISFVETLQVSVSKWALDEKMVKLLQRRISEYSLSNTQ